MFKSTVIDVLRVYRRSWWRLGLSQLVVGVAVGVVLYGILVLFTAAADPLRTIITSGGSTTPGGALLFGLGILVAFAVTCVPLVLAGLGSVATIAADELSGRRPSVLGSLAANLRRVPGLIAVIVVTAGLLLVLVVVTPLTTALGLLGLFLTPLARVPRWRQSRVLRAWPSLRTLAWTAIPFAWAFRWAARSILAFTAVVLGEARAIPAIRTAGPLVESRRGVVVLSVVTAWLVTVLLGAAVALLGYLSGGDLGAQLAQVVAQLLLYPLGLVVVTALYRACHSIPSSPRTPSAWRLPLRTRPASAGSVALVRRVAFVMPAVLLITGVGVVGSPSAAIAETGSSLAITVTTAADDTDASILATQQANCLSAAGDCTLRAALAAAGDVAATDGATGVAIGFAADMTINVTANTPLTYSAPPSVGTLTIDGAGHAVTLDGQDATQIMTVSNGAWNIAVRGLEFRNGRGMSSPANTGGGLYIGGSGTVLVDAVTFSGNTAISGGGLYLAATAEVRNSTFSDNALGGAIGTFGQGGADLFTDGQVRAVNNTFVGSRGGAIYNLGSFGSSLTLDNSLIAISASDAQGGPDCSGGGISGTTNVVAFGDTSCPGTVPSPAAYLGPLARTTPGSPPVHHLFPVAGNPAIGAGSAVCPPTDARGVARPANGCDAGAYQLDPATTLTLESSQNPAPYGDRIAITARVAAPSEPDVIVAGSVQFQIDGEDYGAPAAVVGGTARLELTPVASGAYSITASFTADPFYVYSPSVSTVPLAQSVTMVGTEVRLQTTRPRVLLGDEVTFTIDVGDETRPATGTVDLIDVSTGADVPVLESQPLDGGSALLTVSSLAAGSHELVAAYSGDGNNLAGRSTRLDLIVLSPSTVAVDASAASAVFGAPLTFTASVPASAGTTPTGSVVFTGAGGTALGTVSLDGGTAALTLDRLAEGTRTVVARYLGDDIYAESPDASESVTITPAPTSTSLEATPSSPTPYGVPVTLSATVRNTAAESTADPAGTVSFTLDASVQDAIFHFVSVTGDAEPPVLATVTLVGNGDGTSSATYTTTSGDLPVGASVLIATHLPSADFSAGDAVGEALTVVPVSTSVSLVPDVNPAPIGSTVRFTAAVAPAEGTAVPTGNVTFFGPEGQELGSFAVEGGVAVLTHAGLGLGSHDIRAEYSGASEFLESTATVTQTMSAATTITTLTPERTSSVFGQDLSADITVAGSAGGSPDGTVVVSEGDVTHAIVTVTDGVASVDLRELGAGTHTLTATFRENGGYLSSGAEAEVTITSAPTSTTLRVADGQHYFGDSVALTATVVTTDLASDAVPRGTVHFRMGGALLGSVEVTPDGMRTSTATFEATELPQSSLYPRGELPLTAEFVPAPENFATSSGDGAIVVRPGTTQIGLAVTPGTVGTDIIATATISVTNGAGQPTGTVRFITWDGETVVPVADGMAKQTLRLPRGTSLITAVYTSGDYDFVAGVPAGSDTIGVRIEVGQGTPEIELKASGTPPLPFGSPVTLTAEVSGGGPLPSGQVTFTAQGTSGEPVILGTAPLLAPLGIGSPEGTATAVLETSDIPVGAQQLTAVYSGDLSYTVGQSTSLAYAVTSAATSTTVTASSEPSAVGASVTYSAVVSTGSGAIPAGSVVFTIDGVVGPAVALSASGVATVVSVPEGSGSVSVVADFTPADGNTASSTGSLEHAVVAMPTSVVLSADPVNALVGAPVTFVVSVTPPAAYETVTDALPTGDVTITASDGSNCSAPISMRGPGVGEVLAECSITFASTGNPSVTADYSGDDYYAPGATHPLTLNISRAHPAITFASIGERAWVGGETAHLAWAVAGPAADDTPITVTRNGATVCTSLLRSGGCDYTFRANDIGPASFTLRYSGNDGWLSGSAELSQTVSGCVPATAPNASPAGSGVVEASPLPNCAGGTGYLAGTSVRYTPEPAEGYLFDWWLRGTDTVTAVMGGVVSNTAFMTVQCVTVRLGVTNRDGGAGRIDTSPSRPDCAAGSVWSESSSAKTGQFRPGTEITLTAVAPEKRPGPVRFYQWSGLGADADPLASATTVTVHAGEPLYIDATFGVVCFHNVSFPEPSGGTAELGAPNCTDPSGTGYAADSSVPVGTTATGSGYFSGWTSPGITAVVSTATGSSGLLRVVHDNLVVRAEYGNCVQVDLAVEGALPSGIPLGSAIMAPTGNCPSQGDGWYTPGSTVRLEATPSNSLSKFGGWSGLAGVDRPTSTTAWATISTGGTVTATFYSAMRCVPITLVSVPAGALDLSASFLYGTGTCPAGQYDTAIGNGPSGSNQVTVTATPITEAARVSSIGWAGSTKRLDANSISQPTAIPPIPGATVTTNVYGPTTLVAYACQGLDARLTLISPNGTPHTTPVPADTDFFNVAPTPTCGFGRTSYTLGSSVFVLADGTSPGYDFVGWSGALTSAEEYPTTPVAFPGGSPIGITATYQVTCFTLASNFDNVAVEPAPNCPDAPAGEHSYIGGTTVTMLAAGDGDLVFRGWTGDPEVADGAIAVTNMTSDMAVYANYTSKSVGERITDVVNTVGDTIAIAGKKIVGVAAAVVGGLMMGANPITAAMGVVVLLGQAVQGVADLLGVSSAGLTAFTSAISQISQLMTFMNAATQCATVWSAGADGSMDSQAASASQQVGSVIAREVLAERNSAALAAARLAQQQAIAASFQNQSAAMAGTPLSSATGATLGEAKHMAGRLGAVVAVGAGIYGMVSSGSGVQWDSSASSAWTTGGDAYMNCYGQAIPSFFGLPPVPQQ